MKFDLAGGALRTPLGWRLIGVAAGCVVLGAEIAAGLPPTSMPPRIASPTGAERHEPASVMSPMTPRQSYQDIVAQPLFYASRQPWVAPAASVPPRTAIAAQQARPARLPPRNYTLAGIVLSGGIHTALLRAGNGGKIVMLSEGQELEGWTLREILADQVDFESDGATFTLSFPSAPKTGKR